MSPITVSNVQKMGGLPGSNKQTPNPPIVGGALSRPARMSDMPIPISENTPMSCPYCLPIGFFYHAPARFAFQCGPCKIKNCQTPGTMRAKNVFPKHWCARLYSHILAVCWRFVLIRQLVKINPAPDTCVFVCLYHGATPPFIRMRFSQVMGNPVNLDNCFNVMFGF